MPELDGYRRLIREAVTDLTEQTAMGTGIGGLLRTVTTAAVALVRGAQYADVILIDGERIKPLAPTSPCTTELGAIQLRHGHGPCIDAAVHDAVVRSPDLAREDRWPDFTRAALYAGVRSVLTFPLRTPEHEAGALNIYGAAAGTFNAEDEAIGATLAAHASIMLVAAEREARSDAVLADREAVGRATGILMERFHVGADRALEMLAERCEKTGESLRSVADDITARPEPDDRHQRPRGGGGI
ncbi:MAG: GAF and ANTAR domain-containing protein [Mycobacterium sp.]